VSAQAATHRAIFISVEPPISLMPSLMPARRLSRLILVTRFSRGLVNVKHEPFDPVQLF
jgi:hypothetical protein